MIGEKIGTFWKPVWVSGAIAGVALTGALGDATADEAPQSKNPHHHGTHVVGKIVSGTSRAVHGTAPLFGPGFDVEVSAPFGFEAEVATAVLLGSAADGDHLTHGVVEFIVKRPMKLSKTSEVYVGGGPAVNFLYTGGAHDVVPGIAAVVGAYLWQDQHVALMVEFAYATVFEEVAAHDVEGAVGVVYGF